MLKDITIEHAFPRSEAESVVVDARGHYWLLIPIKVADRPYPKESEITDTEEAFVHWHLRNHDTGQKIPMDCSGKNVELSAGFHDVYTDFAVNWTGRYLGTAKLGPTEGANIASTDIVVYDLVSSKCLGEFEHGDEVLDFAINADGCLAVTSSYNELHIWHVPTVSIVKTVYGKTQILRENGKTYVLSGTEGERLAILSVPSNVEEWLAGGTSAPGP